jgi:hypothetical protein
MHARMGNRHARMGNRHTREGNTHARVATPKHACSSKIPS